MFTCIYLILAALELFNIKKLFWDNFFVLLNKFLICLDLAFLCSISIVTQPFFNSKIFAYLKNAIQILELYDSYQNCKLYSMYNVYKNYTLDICVYIYSRYFCITNIYIAKIVGIISQTKQNNLLYQPSKDFLIKTHFNLIMKSQEILTQFKNNLVYSTVPRLTAQQIKLMALPLLSLQIKEHVFIFICSFVFFLKKKLLRFKLTQCEKIK